MSSPVTHPKFTEKIHRSVVFRGSYEAIERDIEAIYGGPGRIVTRVCEGGSYAFWNFRDEHEGSEIAPAVRIETNSAFRNVLVSVRGLENVTQAAGWAVLHMYGLRRSVASQKDWHIEAPGVLLADRFAERLEQRGHSSQSLPLSIKGVRMFSKIIPSTTADSSVERYTKIRVNTPQGEDLSDTLIRLKEQHALTLPEYPTSEIIGRLVGAKAVEPFCQAWHRARAIEDPVEASRSLLLSGVFLPPE